MSTLSQNMSRDAGLYGLGWQANNKLPKGSQHTLVKRPTAELQKAEDGLMDAGLGHDGKLWWSQWATPRWSSYGTDENPRQAR